MKIYKIVVAGIVLLGGMRYYTNAAHHGSLDEEESCEPAKRVRLTTPKSYKLVLVYNGQSLEFAKELLDQSNRFSAEIRFLISSGRQNERALPVTQYITELRSNNPDEVTLYDLHAILSVLTEHNDRQQEALEKLLFPHPSSLAWLMNLVGVAGYYDIPPLFTYATARFGKEFAKYANDTTYREALATLPDEWQMAVTPDAVKHNEIIRHFLDTTPLRRLRGHRNFINSVAWSPDSTQLASGSYDHTIKLWNGLTGELIRTLSGHTAGVMSVGWSPDGKQLASASADKMIKVWDVATGTVVRTLQGHEDSVVSVAWSPDGTQLASASGDATLKLWNVATGTIVRTWPGTSELVNAVAWSPDGAQLASNDLDAIKLWNPHTGTLTSTLDGNDYWVHAVAWSPDSTKLASALDDNSIKLWDVALRRIVHTLEDGGIWVNSVAWSPESRRLASNNNDTIKIWDIVNGTLERTLRGHKKFVNSVAWSPDGTQLASGSEDSTIALWPTSAHLWQLTLAQFELLEKMIHQKRKSPSQGEASVFESFPAVWKLLISQAFNHQSQ